MKNAKSPPTVQLPITESGICQWLGQASPDQMIEYHRGFLAMDAGSCSSALDASSRRQLVLVAERARWAAGQGLVHLVQRRLGSNDFSYLAIVRRKPRARPLKPQP